MFRQIHNKLLILLVITLLLSCGTSGRLKNWNPSDYTVKTGDTLYSIAWRYELNPGDLAKWNRLDSPNLIQPGQRLHMRMPTEAENAAEVAAEVDESSPYAQPAKSSRQSVTLITVDKGDTLYSLAKKHDLTVKQLASMNGLEKPYNLAPGRKLRISLGTGQSAGQGKPVRLNGSKSTKKLVKTIGKLAWRWPVKGKLLSKFNKRKIDAKGIDISGREGATIKAAAPGKVVYSGNGLINYGNLIIIKHNTSYLSAYAHNKQLLVKEGQEVRSGQAIAKLGKTGAEKYKLHFEIRRNGKPVNPLNYLPRS